MSPGAPERPSGSNSHSVGAGTEPGPTGTEPGQKSTDRRRTLGAEGEDLAAKWYEDDGYEILERNWRRREGEIDLIVRRGRTVAFCEVKTSPPTGSEPVSNRCCRPSSAGSVGWRHGGFRS